MAVEPATQAITSPVPFFDLGPSHALLKYDLFVDLEDLLKSGAFTNGPQVGEFEEAFASYCGMRHCVGMASGLDGLRLALLGLGAGPGDEVLVPALTFVATFEAVSQTGAVPVPVDVTDVDYNIDPELCEAAITSRTRVVLPVHLYGQLADMRRLTELCKRRDLLLVEDACQAHGAARNGIRAGSAGAAAAFSFFPAKNLGAFGDAGCTLTNDAALAGRLRALREHGQQWKYEHGLVGYTARLDTIQALVLLRKLPFLDRWNEERRSLAARYCELLAGVGDLRLPNVAPGSEPVWHLFVVRTGDPTRLARALSDHGIMTGRHYPEPPHLSKAYESLGYSAGAFPVAEAMARECMSLPLFPGMKDSQVESVCSAIERFFDGD